MKHLDYMNPEWRRNSIFQTNCIQNWGAQTIDNRFVRVHERIISQKAFKKCGLLAVDNSSRGMSLHISPGKYGDDV